MQPCPDQALGAPSRVTAGLQSHNRLGNTARPPVANPASGFFFSVSCAVKFLRAVRRVDGDCWMRSFLHRASSARVQHKEPRAAPARCRNPCVKKAHQFLVQAVGRVASNRPWPDFVRKHQAQRDFDKQPQSRRGLVKRVQHGQAARLINRFAAKQRNSSVALA